MSETEFVSELTTTAETLLTRVFGGPVALGAAETLREHYRNHVLRCPVLQGPDEAPASVIIKASVGEGEDIYNPEKDDLGNTAWRFYNEWAGTRFLNQLDPHPPLCACLLGGDREKGLFLLEDLGTGECLADVVQREDPDQAERALFSYARTLGRMHAETTGQDAEWRRIRLSIGSSEQKREREGIRWLRENVDPFRRLCAELDIALPDGFEQEVAAVQKTVDHPGPFDAFSPNDTCPDNHRIMPDGSLRFFDFEFGGYRHALLDAAYFHMPFPTCWCVNRLPAGLPQRLEDAYRAELIRGCQTAADDTRFYMEIGHACAYWTLSTISWSLEEDLKADGQWGISTRRQRHLLRLMNFADMAEARGYLPNMSAVALALLAKLQMLWADSEPMPLYSAFRQQSA